LWRGAASPRDREEPRRHVLSTAERKNANRLANGMNVMTVVLLFFSVAQTSAGSWSPPAD